MHYFPDASWENVNIQTHVVGFVPYIGNKVRYIDKFAPFHNQMSVIHNILSNFYKPYISIKLEVQG